MFFVVGGLATFFDLLTVPIITLGIPLTLLILLQNKQDFNIKKSIIEIIKLSILWVIGYVMIFVSKWVIASIILQKDAITVAINQIFFRVNGSEDYPATRLGAIKENLKMIFNDIKMSLY